MVSYDNPNIAVGKLHLNVICNLNCLHCGSSAEKTRLDELTNK